MCRGPSRTGPARRGLMTQAESVASRLAACWPIRRRRLPRVIASRVLGAIRHPLCGCAVPREGRQATRQTQQRPRLPSPYGLVWAAGTVFVVVV